MTEQKLKKLIAFIIDPDYVVMWNDGYDKYMVLKDNVHEHDDELKVGFKDFRAMYVDINSCNDNDFLFFNKEIS